jgi:hypothetical protein
MSLQKTDAPLACLSRRSIVSAAEGVYYSSEDGLVLVGPAGVQVVTSELISREQWRTVFGSASIKGCTRTGSTPAYALLARHDGYVPVQAVRALNAGRGLP